jgi:hypothetical protein
MNLDPIRPYLSLIKTIVAGFIICGLFVAGCVHGERNKQKEVDKVQTNLTVALDANRKWVTANEEANRQVEANKKAAAEQQKLAETKAKELVAFRAKTDKKIAKLSDQLDAAMEEPECVDLLKAQFCAAVPLPLQP